MPDAYKLVKLEIICRICNKVTERKLDKNLYPVTVGELDLPTTATTLERPSCECEKDKRFCLGCEKPVPLNKDWHHCGWLSLAEDFNYAYKCPECGDLMVYDSNGDFDTHCWGNGCQFDEMCKTCGLWLVEAAVLGKNDINEWMCDPCLDADKTAGQES